MKRPSDQAKLLFLGLLKTVSALAAEPRGVAAAASSAWQMRSSRTTQFTHPSAASWSSNAHAAAATLLSPQQQQQQQQHHQHHHQKQQKQQQPLTLRLARRTDVPSIQRCNLATLPENYNSAFYVQHMRTWPEFCLVVVEGDECNGHRSGGGGGGLGMFVPGAHQQQPVVVAYVLGKVEERRDESVTNNNNNYQNNPYLDQDDTGSSSSSYSNSWRTHTSPSHPQQGMYNNRYDTTTDYSFGHVTSLAVLDDYRRRGLAAALMEQLHYQFGQQQIAAVGLHVRQSNTAATRLYERFGYHAAQHIPLYYGDGEDAYYMVKALGQQPPKQQQQQQKQQQQRQLPFQYEPNHHNHHRSPSQQQQAGMFSSWRSSSDKVAPATTTATMDPLALPRLVGRSEDATLTEPELMTGTW